MNYLHETCILLDVKSFNILVFIVFLSSKYSPNEREREKKQHCLLLIKAYRWSLASAQLRKQKLVNDTPHKCKSYVYDIIIWGGDDSSIALIYRFISGHLFNKCTLLSTVI